MGTSEPPDGSGPPVTAGTDFRAVRRALFRVVDTVVFFGARFFAGARRFFGGGEGEGGGEEEYEGRPEERSE